MSRIVSGKGHGKSNRNGNANGNGNGNGKGNGKDVGTGELLTFNFSNKKNGASFGLEEARHLAEALRSRKWGGLLLRGQIDERVFCSGGNLKTYARLKNKAAGNKINREIRKILSDVAALSIPKACLVSGDCYGGGIELLSCFDFVATVPHSAFALWQRRNGLTFGWGGAERLLARMSKQKLVELSASMRSFGAHEALRFGLVDDVIPAAMIESRVLEWLARAMSVSTPVLRNHAQEARVFERLWLNPEHQRALKKFK